MHLPYACRDSGACCSAKWPIPIERVRLTAVDCLRSDRQWLLPAPGAPSDIAGVLAISESGHCVFHRHGCEIQHVVGREAMPSSCQHFPREVLRDLRGDFVTLSHFCPTAADLLFTHQGPVRIVEGPPAVSPGEAEGLEARDVLPPLLTAGMLMDLEGYSAWEAHMVARLTSDDGLSPEQALDRLDQDLRMLQRWRPSHGGLRQAVADLPPSPPAIDPPLTDSGQRRVIRRFLAARAFASWMAYQGHGVATVMRSLHLTLRALRGDMARAGASRDGIVDTARLKECIRRTDLLLVHRANRDELARSLSSEAVGASTRRH